MKEKKFQSTLLKVLSGLFALALAVVIAQSVSVSAAGKSIRVNTLDELKAAVDNKDITTIYLSTRINDTYTIPAMENAKTKDLVISTYNLDIVNKAVWKSIDIKSVGSYIEAVSGNDISVYAFDLSNFEVAKKKTVKSLAITDYCGYEGTDFYYTLRKGAKIKKVCYKGGKYTDVTNKKNRILEFDGYAFEWGEGTKVKITLDKSGRILNVFENFEYENSEETVFTYDKNGNLLSAAEYSYPDDKKTVRYQYEYKYDSKNHRIQEIDKELNTGKEYKYNKKGKVIYIREYNEEGTVDEITYTYYKNGRLKKTTFVTPFDQKTETTYKYNEYGLFSTIKETSNCNPYGTTSITTYKYDENLNESVYKVKDFDGSVITNYYTYDENGDWISTTVKHSNGETYTYDRNSAG